MGILMILIFILAFILIGLGFQGLVIWGIGSFVCWAFSIPFVFTFLHGVAIALVLSILESFFTLKR